MDGPSIARATDAQSGWNLTLRVRAAGVEADAKIVIEESSSNRDRSADRTR
jgi:hypothetical protein